jgi:hypothetical protein
MWHLLLLFLLYVIIKNLTSDKLIMKILRSLFIYKFIHFAHVHNIICWKHIWHMDKCVDGWSTNLWMNKCYMNFTFSNKSLSQMYFQCTISIHEMYELWMNKFCTPSITKLWDAKFVMNLLCILNGFAQKWQQQCQVWLCTIREHGF